MSQSCSVCVHEAVTRINAALRQGDASLRLLEERFGPSRSALSRHLSHLDGGVSLPPDEPAAAPPPSVTRLRTCSVCMLPDDVFEAIATALASAGPTPSLALDHGVSMSDMTYHAQHRQSEALSRQRWEAEQLGQAPADDPRDPTYRHAPVQRAMPSLVAEADRLQQAALRAAGLGPALFVLRDLTALVLKLAQALEAR